MPSVLRHSVAIYVQMGCEGRGFIPTSIPPCTCLPPRKRQWGRTAHTLARHPPARPPPRLLAPRDGERPARPLPTPSTPPPPTTSPRTCPATREPAAQEGQHESMTATKLGHHGVRRKQQDGRAMAATCVLRAAGRRTNGMPPFFVRRHCLCEWDSEHRGFPNPPTLPPPPCPHLCLRTNGSHMNRLRPTEDKSTGLHSKLHGLTLPSHAHDSHAHEPGGGRGSSGSGSILHGPALFALPSSTHELIPTCHLTQAQGAR